MGTGDNLNVVDSKVAQEPLREILLCTVFCSLSLPRSCYKPVLIKRKWAHSDYENRPPRDVRYTVDLWTDQADRAMNLEEAEMC